MVNYNIEELLKTLFDVKESNWKPADKIPLISKEIEQLKSDLKGYLINCNYDMAAVLQESKELCEESRTLLEDMKACKLEIEEETMSEIVKSIENHDALTKELQRINFAIDIVFDVVQCGRYVKEFDDGREAQSFTRAVEAVSDLVSFIDTPAEGFKYLDLYHNTKNTAQLILENLLHDLSSEWSRLVSWSSKLGSRKTIVNIAINLDDSMAVIDVLSALDKSKKLDEKIAEFSEFLMKEVLIPIMVFECTVVVETDELLTLTINHAKQNCKPPYNAVLANLRLLFQFLNNKLNIEFARDQTLMMMVGKEINNEFKDTLVKEVLVDTVPYNINDLQLYGRVTAEIEEFQQFLTMIKLFPEEKLQILDYMDDIDVLFATRSSQYHLETARAIMLKDLSVTMSIGVETIPDDDQPIISNLMDDSAEQALEILDKTIPKSLFFFPRCMISKTAQELLDLVYVMMEHAVQCSDIVCKRLYYTTRLVFELYDAVVPYHHEKFLQTIPQYVALFHNNCMYLAHNLQTFGDKWLILMEGREVDYAISFVDIVQKLRDLGYKHLTAHMQQQRKQILDNIRSSDLNSMATLDALGDSAETAVRQCLRQLALLKNVWVGVFPNNVFTRLMATLVNMFVSELIHRACTVEDISAEMASQLTEIYTRVLHKAPHVFADAGDVAKHVSTWIKLQELIFVLGGSLKDIDAHWQDGKGPLAKHFRVEELRSLVKALFQNTQLRANLLAKIK